MKALFLSFILLVSFNSRAEGPIKDILASATSKAVRPDRPSRELVLYMNGSYDLTIRSFTNPGVTTKSLQLNKVDLARITDLAKKTWENPMSGKLPPHPTCQIATMFENSYYIYDEQALVGTQNLPCGSPDFKNNYAQKLMTELNKLLNN